MVSRSFLQVLEGVRGPESREAQNGEAKVLELTVPHDRTRLGYITCAPSEFYTRIMNHTEYLFQVFFKNLFI